MIRPRLLDLFCGAGGAAKGYHDAGFDVVGVDWKHQEHYPFDFQYFDIEILFASGWERVLDLYGIDAIHASPPCQTFTAYRRKGHGVGDNYPNLIPATQAALAQSGLPYVIENVEGAPLIDPVRLCGSSFLLDVRRHRLFESNLPLVAPPCEHGWQTPRFPPATNRTNLRSTVEIGVWRIPLETQHAAMGIDWMTLPELSESIPPAYTEWLGLQLLDHLKAIAA